MTDTGSLGLIQMLIQSGIPPQVLLAMLQHQQTLGQPGPQSRDSGGDSGASAPAFTGSTAGNPNGTTGIGALSGGQALGAFGSGLFSGGAIGQGLNALGVTSPTAQSLGAKAATMGLSHTGFPGLPLSIINSLLGGLMGLADAAQRSEGPRGLSPTLSDTLRGRGIDPDPAPTGLSDAAPAPIGFDGNLSLTGFATPDPDPDTDAAVSAAVTGESAGPPGNDGGPTGDTGDAGDGVS